MSSGPGTRGSLCQCSGPARGRPSVSSDGARHDAVRPPGEVSPREARGRVPGGAAGPRCDRVRFAVQGGDVAAPGREREPHPADGLGGRTASGSLGRRTTAGGSAGIRPRTASADVRSCGRWGAGGACGVPGPSRRAGGRQRGRGRGRGAGASRVSPSTRRASAPLIPVRPPPTPLRRRHGATFARGSPPTEGTGRPPAHRRTRGAQPSRQRRRRSATRVRSVPGACSPWTVAVRNPGPPPGTWPRRGLGRGTSRRCCRRAGT